MAAALSAALAGAGTVVFPAAVLAQAPASRQAAQDYAIPAGNLRPALDALVAQSDISLLYSPDLVADKTTRGATGRLTPAEALGRLLEGTALESNAVDATTYVLRPRGQTTPPAQAGQERESMQNATTTAQPAEPEVQELERLTVTGTRIRGGSTPSPVITIGSERIQEEGFADLGEVIRSVPQNFNGGQNPGVAGGAGGASANNVANQNITGGSGLNLRGLGPDATLTLLNGRRPSYGGFVQAVDINAIPVEAVERIEIVVDGASAIYGSDAVAGVGNVILKRDFDGVTLGARYGASTDGGLTTREYTATAGATWSSGGLIGTYKDSSADPVYADQRSYTEHMFTPRTLYPGSDLRSGLLSVWQSLGDVVELRLDALRTEREQLAYTGYSTYYLHNKPETTTSLVSPSIEFSLPGNWMLSVNGTWGKDEAVVNQSRVTIASGLATLSSHMCYCNESRMYEVGAEGPLFVLGGGDARLAVGAGYRTNNHLQRNYLTRITSIEGDESSRFAYAELSLPLIGSGSSIAGVHQLAFTVALRGEDYDSFGGVTTPKFGLIYDPSADFRLKASWGKSFKAPALYQRYLSQYGYLWNASEVGGIGYADDATVLMTFGGNPDLDPERARTWTVSLAFHPEALPGLEAELTWFDIDYTDRVVEPVASYWLALGDPNYAEFIEYSPTVEQQAEIVARPMFYNYAGVPYDPSKVVAIIFDDFVNVARQRVKGIDLSGSYRFDLSAGRLTIRGSASWLDSSQQNSAGQDSFNLAGTIFNPARLSSRLGAVWTRGGFTVSGFANYTSGVTNTLLSEMTDKTASFTTLDAALRYDTGMRGGVLSGFEFALSAQNMFDRTPPLYAVPFSNYVPYDSTNYSAIGRFLSISVSKHW